MKNTLNTRVKLHAIIYTLYVRSHIHKIYSPKFTVKIVNVRSHV